MPKLQAVIDFECFEEFSFRKLARMEEAFITENEDLSLPMSGKYTSSQIIDLLDGFTDLKHLVVIAYSKNGKEDFVKVTFDIEDSQEPSESISVVSPYFVLLGTSSNHFSSLTVTTTNATENDPIYLKIFRLGE